MAFYLLEIVQNRYEGLKTPDWGCKAGKSLIVN